MEEKIIQPWIKVNGYMDVEYRKIVVELAWKQLPQASPELRKFSKSIFANTGEIRGFRSVLKAPPKLALRHITDKFEDNHLVAVAVICLWAEAIQPIIQAFRRAAEAAGIQIVSEWTWESASQGFLDYEDIQELHEFCNTYSSSMEHPEKDHIMLAALWLSRAVIFELDKDEQTADENEMIRDTEMIDMTEKRPEKTADEDAALDITRAEPQAQLSPKMDVGLMQPEPMSAEGATIPATGKQLIPIEDAEELPVTLSEIEEMLNQQVAKVSQFQQAVVSGINSLLLAAQEAQLAGVEHNLRIVQDAFKDWRADESGFRNTIRKMTEKLTNEVESRPDLSLDVPLQSLPSETEFADVRLLALAEALLSIIQRIHQYDIGKQKTLSQIEILRAKTAGLQDELAIWEPIDGALAEVSFQIEQEEGELTLAQLNALLKETQNQHEGVKKRLAQFRELCANRINNLVRRLSELETPDEIVVGGEYTLGSLAAMDLLALESHILRSLEVALVDLLNARMTEVKSAAVATMASELRDKWDNARFVQLLERLAKENRDVEMFLLLLASNSTHPRDISLILDRPVVSGLLSGLGQLSLKSRPFALLSNIAQRFIQGWETSDPISKAELCLLYLAARRGGDYLIPAEILWQIAYDWPVEHMEHWNKLWQAEISDELARIATAIPEEQEIRLEQARLAARNLFARERGMYTRSKLIKNHRHLTLVNNELLPKLQEQLDFIQQLDDKMQNAAQNRLPNLCNELNVFLTKKSKQAVDSVFEAYESEIGDEEVEEEDSPNPAWRTLNECADSVQHYGRELLDYWQVYINLESGISIGRLKAEMNELAKLSSLGQAAIEQVIATTDKTLLEWDAGQADGIAMQHIEQEVLNQAVYTMRLPRLVGCLTRERLKWDRVLENILDDLAEPLDYSGIANYLLEQGSPNQALFLTQYVPLEIQKRAQQLKIELEKEIEHPYIDLLHLGGNADDLHLHKDLGRWHLLRQELNTRIRYQKATFEAQKQQSLDQARKLRSIITELDDEIFDIRDTLPVEAYQIIEQGLTLARKSCDKETKTPFVQAYIDEVRYRLIHKSWPIGELQKSYDELYRQVLEEGVAPDTQITIEKVLELFEQSELKPLGLAPADIPASSIGTRIDLLRNWITLRTSSGFRSEDLKVSERNAIQQIFRYFAKMMAMKRTLDPQGQPIAYEEPVIFSYMDLQFPKTAVLDNHCIFIAIPGDPPAAENLKHLELILEDRQWLDYFFVFLFGPGCTSKIRDRLQSSYRKQGLVIIDDSTLLQMVLAEKFERNPVGKLRPLMLNALEADNVDVFKINQLVDSHSAIFVGRDREVERYASREGNYAVYGGRRIGKSSVIKAVEKLLLYRGARVIYHSFEGQADCSDDHSAMLLTQLLKLEAPVQSCGDLKFALQSFVDDNPNLNLVILLDEIDRYIESNPKRHVLIETMRSLSERYGSRFRVVISGFMYLYDCLNGHGPYSPASDPWGRMLNDTGPLENLRPVKAEEIVKEGFLDILGWNFESRAISQRIVELTGGHPAFVQDFCLKVQQRVGARGDRLVKLDDVQAVFSDRDPEQSFIAYVRKTLEMNLDPVGHYLILLLALESKEKKGFTFDEILAYASSDQISIPDKLLERSLERLKVTSVVKEITSRVYEFSVPDYPSILIELGENAHMERLEHEVVEYIKRGTSAEG